MLIDCVAYQHGQKIASVSLDDVKSYMKQPDCFIWASFQDSTDVDFEQMMRVFDLHPLALDDIRGCNQRPKLVEFGKTLFSVIHLLELKRDGIEAGEIDMFVNERFVLSVRSRSDKNFNEVRQRCEDEPHLLQQGTGFVFYAILDAAVDRYFDLLDQLEQEFESIDDEIFRRNSSQSNIRRLYELKLKILTLRQAAVPMLQFVGKLHGGRVPPVCVNSQEYFRDVHDQLARIVLSLDALRDSIFTAIQVNISMVSIEESEITKKLASWAAIFAITTAMAGIWGMNFKHMPELQMEWGYPIALGLIFLVGLIVHRKLKHEDWL